MPQTVETICDMGDGHHAWLCHYFPDRLFRVNKDGVRSRSRKIVRIFYITNRVYQFKSTILFVSFFLSISHLSRSLNGKTTFWFVVPP